jgi:hypothetical protein
MMYRWLTRTLVAAALVVSPVLAAAQSPALSAADAAPFLGTWTISLDSPQGAFEQTLVLKEANGKVVGEVTSPIAPSATPMDEIAKSGNDLVLKFQGDFQGQAFAAAMTLTPDGADKANVTFDVMNGQFVMQGTGVKAK